MGLTKILPSPIWPVLVTATRPSIDALDLVVADDDFEAQFGQETHDIFGAAIDFRMALLASVAFSLGDGHAVDFKLDQLFAHVVEFEGFDDGCDELHVVLPQ